MSRRASGEGEGATAGESALVLDDAFWQMAQGLVRLQEALRLQEQVAERRLQEALRLERQSAERALNDAVGGMEEKLQEKNAAICALEDRVSAVEGRAEEVEASLQRALQRFFPRVDELVRRLEEAPSAVAAAGGEGEASVSARGAAAAGAVRPQGPGAGQGETVDEQQLQRQRLQRSIEELKRRMASPSKVGQDLMSAVCGGRLEEARRLLDAGADVNHIGGCGNNPLHFAVIRKHDDVVALLLERGALRNAVNVFGSTAMHWAAMYDHSGRCVDLLIGAGGDVDARNEEGETPLHLAAKWNNKAAVRALLAAGARRDLKAWGGRWKNKTPIDIATSFKMRDFLL